MSYEITYADRLLLAKEHVRLYLEKLPGNDVDGACIEAAEVWADDYHPRRDAANMPEHRRMSQDLCAWQRQLQGGVDN